MKSSSIGFWPFSGSGMARVPDQSARRGKSKVWLYKWVKRHSEEEASWCETYPNRAETQYLRRMLLRSAGSDA
jgi:hypothetical protein